MSCITTRQTATTPPNYMVRDIDDADRTGSHGLQGSAPAALGRAEADGDLQAHGRRAAVGHALPAARLQGRAAAADDRLGLSAEFTDADTAGQVVGLDQPLHARRRRLAPVPPDPGLRDARRRDDADRRRPRDRERHLRRADRRRARRPRSTTRSRPGSPTATASASAATATARS